MRGSTEGFADNFWVSSSELSWLEKVGVTKRNTRATYLCMFFLLLILCYIYKICKHADMNDETIKALNQSPYHHRLSPHVLYTWLFLKRFEKRGIEGHTSKAPYE